MTRNKDKLFILLAILLSVTPAIFFLYDGVDDWLSIARATITFTIIALILSPLVYFISKKIDRPVSYLNAYNISGILQITFLISAAIYINNNNEVKGFESIRTGDDKNYEFSGKEYFLDSGELKTKITVKVIDGSGDSIVTHYSKSGKVIDEKKNIVGR